MNREWKEGDLVFFSRRSYDFSLCRVVKKDGYLGYADVYKLQIICRKYFTEPANLDRGGLSGFNKNLMTFFSCTEYIYSLKEKERLLNANR